MNRKKIVSLLISAALLFNVTPVSAIEHELLIDGYKNTMFDGQEWQQGQQLQANILTVLMDFPNYKYTDFVSKEPDRMLQYDSFEKELYRNMMFGDDTFTGPDGNLYNTVNKYYKEISGNAFSLKGDVVGWYTASKNIEYYGDNKTDHWAGEQYAAAQLVKEAIVKAAADTSIDLSKYDVWDPEDNNGNGKYREKDKEIEYFIVVHAGMGEEMRDGGSVGENAIWPFQWNFTDAEGEKFKVTDHKGETYTFDRFLIVEQDALPGLIAHEFGHIIGLPDIYGDGDTPVQAWSHMDAGGYTGKVSGLMPTAPGAFCREYFQRIYGGNWSTMEEVNLEEIPENGMDFRINEYGSDNTDLIRIDLPDRAVKSITEPQQGSNYYFSGKGNDLRNSMSTTIDLTGKSSATLEFKTWYDLDPGFDFASVQAREVGSEEWIAVAGNLTTTEVDPWVAENESPEDIKANRNPGHGITNDSGNKWVHANFDLKDFVGKNIELRVNFWTDGNTPEEGIYLDEIKVLADGEAIFNDDAEGETKFELNGFTKSDGLNNYENYYLLEWRNHNGVDVGLKHLAWHDDTGSLEYNPGLVVWYVNTEYFADYGRLDQATSQHPGYAGLSVVDADQNPVKWYSGGQEGVDKAVYQLTDSAFSIRKPTQNQIEWSNGAVTKDADEFIYPIFDDSKDYSNPGNKEVGVILPNNGLKIYITAQDQNDRHADIKVVRTKK